MTSRVHNMPFGAMPRRDGSVRFALWAPAAREVTLRLYAEGSSLDRPMQAAGQGWFDLTTADAAVGTRYHYVIDNELTVPDPASRYQPEDVFGPSEVIDPAAWDWQDPAWPGRPWAEAVIYELHVGAFTPAGTFSGVIDRLDELVELGVTALQLMPLAEFPGARNWGYDGVLLFAPDSAYGTPHELKAMVQAAHARGLMVYLDVVYNHFGPQGNFLHRYAPGFFTRRYPTPWGEAIDFDPAPVRQFFIHNALYWLEEYHFDGLRFDSVHAIYDDNRPDIMEELAAAVRAGPGAQRPIHLVLENDNNEAHYLRATTGDDTEVSYRAQWNDDFHHVVHILLSGERTGYYRDYAQGTVNYLARCLTEGFAYQGEASDFRQGRHRGEPSADLPPRAFVSFLQNHDQIGNRALGERLSVLCEPPALRAATALLLLAPFPPMLFMGQEWASRRPFTYFVDFDAELGEKVRRGRLEEFGQFPQFADPAMQQRIPPPNDAQTFEQARLAWAERDEEDHRQWWALHRRLLTLRRQFIVPLLSGAAGARESQCIEDRALIVRWRYAAHSLVLRLNLSDAAVDLPEAVSTDGLVFATPDEALAALAQGGLPAWTTCWFVQPSAAQG